jgi:hypothetical protein
VSPGEGDDHETGHVDTWTCGFGARHDPVWVDRGPDSQKENFVMAVGTLALATLLFALFFGLVVACERL